jgi:hypothetical protein
LFSASAHDFSNTISSVKRNDSILTIVGNVRRQAKHRVGRVTSRHATTPRAIFNEGNPFLIIAIYFIHAHEFQTILWTYIYTPVARDTQLAVEDWVNRAQETARSLCARSRFVKT